MLQTQMTNVISALHPGAHYAVFEVLPASFTKRLTPAQKATLARLGNFVFDDASREDSLTRNWCENAGAGWRLVGECSIRSADRLEGRGAYLDSNYDLHEGYWKYKDGDGSYKIGVRIQGRWTSYKYYNKDGSIYRTYP